MGKLGVVSGRKRKSRDERVNNMQKEIVSDILQGTRNDSSVVPGKTATMSLQRKDSVHKRLELGLESMDERVKKPKRGIENWNV